MSKMEGRGGHWKGKRKDAIDRNGIGMRGDRSKLKVINYGPQCGVNRIQMIQICYASIIVA